MQTALIAIGFVLLYLAIGMRVQRWEDYQAELESAQYDKRSVQFWGGSTEHEDERIAEIKREGYGNLWTRVKFNAATIAMGAVGLILLLFYHLHEPPDDDSTSVFTILMVIGGISWFAFTSIQRPIAKLEREVRWLNETLRAVKRHAEDMRKASIDEHLQTRLDLLGEDKHDT